jgi:hypothetical protein
MTKCYQYENGESENMHCNWNLHTSSNDAAKHNITSICEEAQATLCTLFAKTIIKQNAKSFILNYPDLDHMNTYKISMWGNAINLLKRTKFGMLKNYKLHRNSKYKFSLSFNKKDVSLKYTRALFRLKDSSSQIRHT